jgi:hypothetical protein
MLCEYTAMTIEEKGAHMTIEEVIAEIVKLEQEREQIYEDSSVTPEEHPRLAHIEAELPKLWDLRRRLEAAKAAGLSDIPVPPPADPSQLIG